MLEMLSLSLPLLPPLLLIFLSLHHPPHPCHPNRCCHHVFMKRNVVSYIRCSSTFLATISNFNTQCIKCWQRPGPESSPFHPSPTWGTGGRSVMATHEQNQAPSFLPPTFAKGQSRYSTWLRDPLKMKLGLQQTKGGLSFLPTPPAAAGPPSYRIPGSKGRSVWEAQTSRCPRVSLHMWPCPGAQRRGLRGRLGIRLTRKHTTTELCREGWSPPGDLGLRNPLT